MDPWPAEAEPWHEAGGAAHSLPPNSLPVAPAAALPCTGLPGVAGGGGAAMPPPDPVSKSSHSEVRVALSHVFAHHSAGGARRVCRLTPPRRAAPRPTSARGVTLP